MADFQREIPNNFSLPRRINRLGKMAYNLWWSWNPEVQLLYQTIDKILWGSINHNPVAFLHKVSRPRLNAMITRSDFLSHYDRSMQQFDEYMQARDTWFKRTFPALTEKHIAYFSFEFGLHESLPVYAGGLGVLSGDHLKEASDLGIPLVAVGFVYNQGYFSQHITEDGWQETSNIILNFEEMPITPLYDSEHKPLLISVDLPGRKVYARLWEVAVGRVSLFLLDSNIEENSIQDRQLTARLYSSDLEVRISQEILLGIGGVRALRLLGYDPSIWHMNEGHSAFLALERIRELVAAGSTYQQAAEKVRLTDIFTTHTPVPAGNDQFPLWLMDKYFSQYWTELGLSHEEFTNIARHDQAWGETFSMPVLALRLSEQRNAVSELHGQVSRKMWRFLWPDKREDEVPITSITNAVHTCTWLGRRLRALYEKYLGADWIENLDNVEYWKQIENIPDDELWSVRTHLKRKLVNFANERIRQQWLSGSIHPAQVVAGGVFLEPYSLLIGFGRRFATYKRGNLILRDFDRLLRLLNNIDMPVQFIFAGKAHPADEPGKLIIQQVYRAIKDSRSGGRMAFLEDYDMNVARYLVQGVDVWLNTPRRPNEASGTSGMKAALNGVLNFSVLDGWWREGYNGHNGWAIGGDKDYADPTQGDEADARSLYDTLENEIIPLFYNERNAVKMPVNWVATIKESLRTLVPQFSMQRMVKEYMNELYLPALESEKPSAKNKKR